MAALAKLVVCAIALHEELYIDEWLTHNFKIGFERTDYDSDYKEKFNFVPYHK
jgi:hypothetical protein